MARSSYVYVIRDRRIGELLAVFTVKYELASWLTRNKLTCDRARVDRCHTMRGRPPRVEELDIDTLRPVSGRR